MTRIYRFALALGTVLIASATSLTSAFSETATPAQIRDSATRAVALLEASQVSWNKKQACSSCHQQFQPAIAFAVARAHGIPVDEALAATNRARHFRFDELDEALQYANPLEPALGNGYRLLAAHAAGISPTLATAIEARFLIARQRPAGDWAGLNQRPPSSSSDFAKTAIGLRAVQLFHHPADKAAADDAIARAARWLLSHDAPDTEGRVYQLLGLQWTGADRRTREGLAHDLETTQRADGGWGSVPGRESEAYSTGEVLFALAEAGGVSVSAPSWQRGLAFLIRTQAADGSWHVPSRLHDPARMSPPYFESDYPYGHDQFISAAGAAWSIMALAQALPASSPSITGPTATAAVTPSANRWIETAVFGSIADLRRLLDDGLDVNASTSPGKTTLLMMTATDPEKLHLLLDRGADVNAQALSGYTAVVVAAQARNAAVTVGLLLDRGAGLPKGNPGTGLSALGIAAHAGNADILGRLHHAGDPLETPFLPRRQGRSPTPMEAVVRNGDLDVVRQLLDLGARVDGTSSEPWSPLELAVLNNRVDFARLFLERGADVNFADKAGYAPLLLAASIDFGDTMMIDLLLAAGARVDARNRDGKTALDLAREYGHARFVPNLERAAHMLN